jgi:hypothetical protein
MDASASHVVIVGGPETEDELLIIVLDDGKAVPLFDSVEEAQDFLVSLGEFGEEWHALQVSARELIEVLDYQEDDVEYVALSPPPEKPEGGMEVQVLYREILTDLLKRQTTPDPPSEGKSFWRRILGR